MYKYKINKDVLCIVCNLLYNSFIFYEDINNWRIKDMDKYEMYCTAEQTWKAIQLGAPIKWSYNRFDDENCSPINVPNEDCFYAVIPTVTQMMCWLEYRDEIGGIDLDVYPREEDNNLIFRWQYFIYNKFGEIINENYLLYSSHEEAALKAIDVALKYLTNNKK